MGLPSRCGMVTLSALAEGCWAAGRSMDDYEISGLPFVVTETSEEEMALSALAVREQIAFYASTPAYRPAGGSWLGRSAG